MAEICAISGHSPTSVEAIMQHYRGTTRELVDAGIDKLGAWVVQDGIVAGL